MVTRTDGPFEYWKVTGDAVRAAGEKPGSDAAVIQSLAGELEGDEKNAAAAIEGDIEAGVTANTTAAKDTAASLARKGTYAVGLLNQFAKDVDEFDGTVNQINLDYNNQVQTNISTARTEASHEAKDGEEPAAVDTGAIASAVKASFLPRYQKAEGIIDDAADLVASMFKSGPTDANVKDLIMAGLIPFGAAGLFPSVHLTADEKQQALANTIKGMTPEQQAKYVQDHKEIDAKTASVISPEAQTILADDVADDVKDKKVDAETVRILSLLQDQHPFAHAFYSQVTPDQMSEAIQKLSSDTYPNGPIHAGASGTGNDPLDKGKIELYKNFLSAAGGTLATYSTGTGQYAPPADAGITWGKAITDEDHGQNAGALSLLLREGGDKHEFGGQFLSDVGDTVYKYEQEHKDDSPWGSRGSQVIDPDAKIGNLDDNIFGIRSSDALANVLGAMKNSPDAAQMFFADGYPDDNHDGKPDLEKTNSRLEYLLTERTFTNDLSDFRSGDEGDGLGLALEAATIGNRDHTLLESGGYHDEIAATLASQTFKTIADKSGTDGGFMMEKWHAWPGMTDSLGSIAAGYMHDVYNIVDNNGGIPSPDNKWISDGPPAGLILSLPDLDKVMGEIGGSDDKTGLETVAAASVIESNSRISESIGDFLDTHKGTPLTMEALAKSGLADQLNGQGQTNGTVMRHLLDAGIAGGLAAENEDATRQQYLSKALDVATEFVPTPQGKIAGLITSEGMDFLKEKITAGPDPSAQAMGDKQEGVMAQQIRFGMYNQLLAHNFLDPTVDPDGGLSTNLTVEHNEHRVVRSDLIDADGIGKLDDDLTPSQKAQILKDWQAWMNSPARDSAESLTTGGLNGFNQQFGG